MENHSSLSKSHILVGALYDTSINNSVPFQRDIFSPKEVACNAGVFLQRERTAAVLNNPLLLSSWARKQERAGASPKRPKG